MSRAFNVHRDCQIASTEFLQNEIKLQEEIAVEAKQDGDHGVAEIANQYIVLISKELASRDK